MIKKLLLIIAVLTAVITAANMGSSENDMGSHEYYAVDEGCDSNITYIDTTKVWTDAIAAACSLVCDTGKIYFEWTTDTLGALSKDSAVGKKAPYLYTDTTSQQQPSDSVYVRFRFDADTGVAFDTTTWRLVFTKDSTDTSDYWWYGGVNIPPTISTITISTCSLNVACSLSVTNTDADSIIWQIKPFGGEWADTLRRLATGADTLFRTPTYATRTDSIRAYVFNETGNDTSGALWNPFYTTPTFDSCRAKVRRGTLWTDIKPLDTMYFFFANVEDSTAASELWLNSTGTVKGELIAVAADSITVRIPAGTPRGVYRPRWTNGYGVQSETLTSSVGCPYVKSPSVGAY